MMTDELANAYMGGATPAHTGWALYGATGLTGRLLLERAVARGHRPMLVGRDGAKLAAGAQPHDLAVAVAPLDDHDGLVAALRGQRLVVNAAGPFKQTGGPLMRAAIAAGADYIDLNGELDVLEDLFAHHEVAGAQGVALVGGAGFGVAAGEGLAALAARRLGGADFVRLSVATDSAFSTAGVAESTLSVIAGGGHEVRGGRLVRRALAARRWREKRPDGSAVSFASVPLAELAAVRRSVGARRVVAGAPMAHGQALALSVMAPLLPLLMKIPLVRAQMAGAGGHAGAAGGRTDHVSRVRVEAGLGRRRLRGRLEAGEGFAVAADIALQAVEETLRQRPAPGAHSPATAFGADFIARVPGVRIAWED